MSIIIIILLHTTLHAGIRHKISDAAQVCEVCVEVKHSTN